LFVHNVGWHLKRVKSLPLNDDRWLLLWPLMLDGPRPLAEFLQFFEKTGDVGVHRWTLSGIR
jgi:hypothetical protein